MDKFIDVSNLISDELLDALTEHLLDVYDLAEQSTVLENHDNYTFSCCLYRLTLNATSERFRKSKLVEDYSKNNKSILKVVGSNLYLRFLTTNPTEHRKKHGTDVLEMFDIDKEYQNNLDLFKNNNQQEKNLYGFFFYDKTPDGTAYLKLQVFDEFWNSKTVWSSDKIQDISLEIDETSKEYPAAKLLTNEQLTPIVQTTPDKKKDS